MEGRECEKDSLLGGVGVSQRGTSPAIRHLPLHFPVNPLLVLIRLVNPPFHFPFYCRSLSFPPIGEEVEATRENGQRGKGV